MPRTGNLSRAIGRRRRPWSIQTLLIFRLVRAQGGQAFQHPVSPHWAAERDGVILDPGTLTLPEVNVPSW